MEFEADFVREKDTKNTIRYKEIVPEGQYPKVVTIYIQKGALPSPVPEKIKVKVTAQEVRLWLKNIIVIVVGKKQKESTM